MRNLRGRVARLCGPDPPGDDKCHCEGGGRFLVAVVREGETAPHREYGPQRCSTCRGLLTPLVIRRVVVRTREEVDQLGREGAL